MNINVGDVVTVVGPGHTYDLYDALAAGFGLTNWQRNQTTPKGKYTVISVKTPFYALQNEVGEQYMVNDFAFTDEQEDV